MNICCLPTLQCYRCCRLACCVVGCFELRAVACTQRGLSTVGVSGQHCSYLAPSLAFLVFATILVSAVASLEDVVNKSNTGGQIGDRPYAYQQAVHSLHGNNQVLCEFVASIVSVHDSFDCRFPALSILSLILCFCSIWTALGQSRQQ